MLNDQIVSLIRTVVPVAVGAFLTWLTTELGVGVAEDAGTALTVGLVGLFTALYYTLARVLEQRWPWLGVLLGSRRQPTYGQPNNH